MSFMQRSPASSVARPKGTARSGRDRSETIFFVLESAARILRGVPLRRGAPLPTSDRDLQSVVQGSGVSHPLEIQGPP